MCWSLYRVEGDGVEGGGSIGQELTRTIISNDSESFPRFEGKVHVTKGGFRAARIRIREVPGRTKGVGLL